MITLAPYHYRRRSRPDHRSHTRGSLTGNLYPTAMSGTPLENSFSFSACSRSVSVVSGMMSDVDWSRVSFMHYRVTIDRRSYVSVAGERP